MTPRAHCRALCSFTNDKGRSSNNCLPLRRDTYHNVALQSFKKLQLDFDNLKKTSQEFRMLSSVTINCQVTKIVMNSGSQLSELQNCNQCLKGLQDCLFNCKNGKSNCLNCENCRQLWSIVKIGKLN